MKRLFLSICAISLLGASAQAQTLDRSIRPEPGPAPEIHLGKAESFTLSNGLKVFVVEDHKLPMVTYSIQLDIHPKLQGKKVGIHSFVGELLTDGTTSRTKEEFDKEVDQIGAVLQAGSDAIYGQSLTEFQDKLLDLMSDAVMNANFQQKWLDKLKTQMASGLEASKNNPDAMLENVVSVLNFGKNHPYGEVPSKETIENVTLADCNQYYHTYFRPNVAYMAVVGDITLEEAKKLVTKYFGEWEKAEVPRINYPVVSAPFQTSVAFVPREAAVQSVIGITYPIQLPPGDPDVIKSRALNEILGGSSQGRLFQNLRETHGWTYGAYSSISSDDIAGSVELYAKCRNLVTDSSIHQMLLEMNSLRNEPVTEERLESTLNFMSGKFALALESPQTIARFAINTARYDLPADYYKNYLKNVNAVTVSDVQEMAQKYLKPEKAHIVVVGNPSIADKLKTFSEDGRVHYYDHLGNPIKAPKSFSVENVKVEDILAHYIEAIGGKEAIKQLKDLKVEGIGERMGRQFEIEQMIVSPDKFKQVVSMGGNVVATMVVNGKSGYALQMGQRTSLPDEALKEYQQQADLQVDLHPEKYGITYTLLNGGEVNGEAVYNVRKVSGADTTIESYAVKSGLLLKTVSKTTMQGHPIISINTYSNYQEVENGNGFKLPFTQEGSGTMSSKFTIKSAIANSGIKENEFK